MKKAFVKDTDIEIVGTLDLIEARADISGFGNGFDDPIWRGDGEVFWDSRTTQERDGKKLYLDNTGNEYAEDELELRDVTEA